MLLDDVVECVEGVGLASGQHPDAAFHFLDVAPREEVAQQAHHGAEDALVQVAPCRVDVDGLHEAVASLRYGEVGIALPQRLGEHVGPLVDHGLVEESGLVGDALAGAEAAVLVFAVGQVFFVAAHHVEGGGQQVEVEVEVASVDGEEGPLPVALLGARLLVLDRGRGEQAAALYVQCVADALGTIAELGVTAAEEVGFVGGDAEFDSQHVLHQHTQGVANPVGQSRYMYQ